MGKSFDTLVSPILIAELRPPALLLVARVVVRLELDAAFPGLPTHKPEKGLELVGDEDGVWAFRSSRASKLEQRRNGTRRHTGWDAQVERYRPEDVLMTVRNDDDALGRGIELLLDVGLKPFDVRAQAVEGRAARTELGDKIVELTPDLLP